MSAQCIRVIGKSLSDCDMMTLALSKWNEAVSIKSVFLSFSRAVEYDVEVYIKFFLGH